MEVLPLPLVKKPRNTNSYYNDQVHESLLSSNSTVQLNEHCLIAVFEHLPIFDRIRLERVNKTWQSASLQSWNSFKHMELSRELWGTRTTKYLDKDTLEKVFCRCSKYLTNLDLSRDGLDRIHIGKLYIDLIILCPNLKAIDFGCYALTSEEYETFVQHCKKITSLKSRGTKSYDERVFKDTVFPAYKNLRILKLHNTTIYGDCLRYLSVELIEELHFENCESLNFPIINEVIPRFVSLRKLSLKGSLRYGYTGSYDEILGFLQSINLSYLNISSNRGFVNDNCLVTIAQCCTNLKCLDISGNSDVTDRGIEAIASLSKLESLDIGYLNLITGRTLLTMSNRLKILSCLSCKSLDDNIVCQMLKASEVLKFFRVSYCFNLTNRIISAAFDNVISRENKIPLTMYLYNSGVKLEDATRIINERNNQKSFASKYRIQLRSDWFLFVLQFLPYNN